MSSQPTARAVWFAAPHRVEVAPVAVEPGGENDVVVRTLFSGISSGTELLAYRGELDPALPLDETIGALGGTFAYPFRYGYSCVGVVEHGAGPFDEGALVFAFHPHQDRFVARPDDLVALGQVDARVATLFPLVETALQVTLDAGPVLEDLVVVIGLGVVGLLTSLMLRRSGARVLAAELHPWRRVTAERLGIEAVEPGDLAAAISNRGAASGVPLVVEASGDPSVLSSVLPLVAHEGTVLVASWYGTKQAHLSLGAEFHRRRLTLRSTQVSTIPAALGDRWTPARRRIVVRDLIETLPLEVVATHTFAFDDAAEAFAAVDGGERGLVHAALWYS